MFAVLKLLGVSTTDTPWCMVTELCEFGDLKDLLSTIHEHEFILNCEEKLRLLGNVAAGMHYLSTLQFIHRVQHAACDQDASADMAIAFAGLGRP